MPLTCSRCLETSKPQIVAFGAVRFSGGDRSCRVDAPVGLWGMTIQFPCRSIFGTGRAGGPLLISVYNIDRHGGKQGF